MDEELYKKLIDYIDSNFKMEQADVLIMLLYELKEVHEKIKFLQEQMVSLTEIYAGK